MRSKGRDSKRSGAPALLPLGKSSDFNRLPSAVIQLILSKTLPEDIATVASINRETEILTAELNYWKNKFQQHFPHLFASVSAQAGINWKNEFKKAYREEYPGLSHRIRKLFSAVKESDVVSLKLMNINLEDLECHQDKNKISLLDWIQRINNDEVLNYLYSIAVRNHTVGVTVDTLKCDSRGKTIFYWAISFFQSVDKLKLLLLQGSRITEQYKPQFLPIHIAAIAGRLDVVMELVNADPTLVDNEDSLRETPLIWAAFKGHTAVVEYLIARGANLSATTQVNNPTANNRTSLHWAIAKGHTAAALTLIHAGAALTAAAGHMRFQPLHLAARMGDLAVVKALLEHRNESKEDKAPINLLEQEDALRQTALMHAASCGHTAVVEYLIARGANLSATTQVNNPTANNGTSLHWAIAKGHTAAALTLIHAGAALTAAAGHMRFQPLHLAARMGDLAVVKALLEHRNESKEDKAPINLLEQEDALRQTALMHAASCGHAAVVEYLISRGANLNATTQGANDSTWNNRNALHWAIENGRNDAAKILLKAGATIHPGVIVNFSKVRTGIECAIRANKFIQERALGPDGPRTIQLFFGTWRFGYSKAQEIEAAKAVRSVYLNGANKSCLFKHTPVLRSSSELHAMSRHLIWRFQ